MNNMKFGSEKAPTDKKIGGAGEAGKARKNCSTTISGNRLQQKGSWNNKQNTPSLGNILVVDDTPAQLHLLIKILSEQGYKVRPVPSGQLALNAIESTLPDLILLDILMPQMDGYEVCSKLKASSRTKDVPVIFISALDEVFDKVKAFEVGGVDYITKPFHTQEVVARIENQLTISRLSKQLTEQNVRLSKEIEERKLAEAQILHTKDLFESIFNESTDAIFLVNPETGLTLDCNQRAVELCQVTSKDELLNTQSHILQKESFTPEELHSLLDEIALNGFWSRELECVTKTGSFFWSNISLKPIHVAGQKMNLVRVTDITERKTAEEAVRQSEARFREQAQELKLALNELKCTQSQLIQAEKMLSLGQMVAGVAHEINNPVTFIYGNLTPAREYFQDLSRLIESYRRTYPNPTPEIQQLVEEIELDFLMEDWQQLIDSMQVGAERIRQIVRLLVLFSRQNTSDKQSVDIHKGIDNTLLLLQHRLRVEGVRIAGRDSLLSPEIQVIKDYGQLPKVTCYEGQLNQVFMNLLSNAIEALETQPSPGVITIRTEMSSFESGVGKGEKSAPTSDSPLPTPSIVIRIADNGPGMSEAVLQKIFDPFFTTKSVGSGMGLGLSISYQIIVEKHEGQISCISAPGQGTELIVEIPMTCKS